MFRKIALALLVLVLAFLAFAATRPDDFRVQRSTTIKAPPEKILPLIDDFHRWGAWSPYEKVDPDMKRSFGGAARGKGATYEWNGNMEAGAGRMEILDASPSRGVTIKLDFRKPLEGHDTVDFRLTPRGDSTNVTWAMRGPSPYISKVMGTIFNMDRMVGEQFEQGLASLKAAAER